MSWTVLPEETAGKVADALQPTLIDLIDLHLLGKQAQWTVEIGRASGRERV